MPRFSARSAALPYSSDTGTRTGDTAMKAFAIAAMLAASIVGPAAAADQYIGPNAWGQIEFVMPSGNIGCIYTPAGGTPYYDTVDGEAELSCDRVEPSYVRAILGGWGQAKRLTHVGDAGCCGGVQFRYGNTLDLGEFICWSERTGLTCERTGDSHGFSMSKAKVQVW